MSFLHHGEFEKAVEDLHRYFDYATMCQTQSVVRVGEAIRMLVIERSSILYILYILYILHI